jgi:hypothetical protein
MDTLVRAGIVAKTNTGTLVPTLVVTSVVASGG